MTEHIAYVGLGSNIQPTRNLKLAVQALARRANLLAVSSVWKSPPVEGEGPHFLNAVVKLSTPLAAEAFKVQVLRAIEAEQGRQRGPDRNAPRTLDLDLVIYDDEELDAEIWDVAYIAAPLSQLNPQYESRVTGENIADAAARLLESQPARKTSTKLEA